MKTKKINKKLVLNKKAISNLNMTNVKGGEKEAYSMEEAYTCNGGCFSGYIGCEN